MLIGKQMEVYIDDMIVKIKFDLEHPEDIHETLSILRQFGMKLNPNSVYLEFAWASFWV